MDVDWGINCANAEGIASVKSPIINSKTGTTMGIFMSKFFRIYYISNAS